MIEQQNPSAEYETAKLESYRGSILAKHSAMVHNNDREDWGYSIHEAASWLLHTGSEEDTHHLRHSYNELREQSNDQVDAHTQIFTGVLLEEEDILHAGISQVEAALVAEKAEKNDDRFGMKLYVRNERVLIGALALAGRVDLLDDFAQTREEGGCGSMATTTAKLWVAHITGDEPAYRSAAEEASRIGSAWLKGEILYPSTIREFAELVLPLEERDAVHKVIGRGYLGEGDSGVQLFDFLLRYGVADQGYYSADDLLDEFSVFDEDKLISQFQQAIQLAASFEQDPELAKQHFVYGINDIEEGYESEFDGSDKYRRHAHLRSLMLQTLLLKGETQNAYDLASQEVPLWRIPERLLATNLDAAAIQTEQEKQARIGWVLMKSLERSNELDFKQVEEVVQIRASNISPMSSGEQTILREKPMLLRQLIVVERAIEERTASKQA